MKFIMKEGVVNVLREQIKELLQNECDIRNLDIEVDDDLVEIVIAIIDDSELYYQLLNLDIEL
ncbi:hypothetical protein [Paraclostridium bifermentans]|uniref:hypothetical protein n=1 Tax=Paraclostridium bifermentans TaxID=1490 RepID=UPI0022E6A06D|nr:hypothetical protein [Paraclostridium bifermentans]